MIPQLQIKRDSFLEGLRKKWGYKIGRIYDLMTTPCQNNNFFILAAAFFSAIPEAIFTVNTHDCSDNIWDKGKQVFAPPKGRGGGRHGRRGTPQFGPGEKLPGMPPPTQPGWHQPLWRAGDLIQSIGAKLLIIDAALDLGINWMSNNLEWQGCQQPPDCYGSGAPLFPVYGNNGLTHTCDIAGFPGNVGVAMGIGGFITTVQVGNVIATCNSNTIPFLSVPYIGAEAIKTEVMKTSSGDPIGGDEDDSGGPNANGDGYSSKLESYFAGTQGVFGWARLFEPGGDGDKGGQVSDDAIFTVAGDRTSQLFGNGNPDPCSNFPLTGTSPRGR